MKKEILTLMLFSILIASCKNNIQHTTPRLENITESVYASGIITSNHQYKVFSKVNGIIQDILVSENDLVHKGDILIKMENTTAALNTVNAGIVADYSARNANSERIREMQNNIALAKSKMEEDALLLQRQQNLWNENIGSKNELEQKQLAYQNSTTAYHAAQLRFTQLEKEINFQDKQAQNNLVLAETMKGDFVIRSEVDGKVYAMLAKKGELISPLNPIAMIGDGKDFTIELQVDEYDITRIKAGQKILVSLDSYKGKVFEATVNKINPLMNERSKSFTVEAIFIQPPPSLYPNLTCEANIVIQQKEKTMTIPRSYLLEGDSVVLSKGIKRKVITGLKDYQKVEIVSGLLITDIIYNPVNE